MFADLDPEDPITNPAPELELNRVEETPPEAEQEPEDEAEAGHEEEAEPEPEKVPEPANSATFTSTEPEEDETVGSEEPEAPASGKEERPFAEPELLEVEGSLPPEPEYHEQDPETVDSQVGETEPDEAAKEEKEEKSTVPKNSPELKLDSKTSGPQNELEFDNAPRGRFEGENPNVFEGEDLDLPPFLRKKKR